MKIFPKTYYHLYNRSNNREILFKEEESYLYFLQHYRKRFESKLDTIAYCLMPTHFHFLVYIKEDDPAVIPQQIGVWLSAYTKAVNKRFHRNGCLFQRHTKAIPVDDEKYLLALLTYIHQNPVRSGLVNRLEDWSFSSYPDYIGIRNDSLSKKDMFKFWFRDVNEFKIFSEELIKKVERKYWV